MIELIITFFVGLILLLAIIIVMGYTFLKVQDKIEYSERSKDD